MSCSSGPGITSNGLVFLYDIKNTKKSWLGKPTTNMGTIRLHQMGISLTNLGDDEDGWTKYGMSGTWTGGTYPYIMHITSRSFTGGVTYSSQIKVRTNVEHKFNYFASSGISYVNQPKNVEGSTLHTSYEENGYTVHWIRRQGFQYTNTTSQPGYLFTNPIANMTFDSSTDFVWCKEGQVEQSDICTPFAGDSSTRSSTQSVIDLTGNATCTVNNLVYFD
jgi:hypothetical protein